MMKVKDIYESKRYLWKQKIIMKVKDIYESKR